MDVQQNQIPLQSKTTEPNDEVSRSIGETSRCSIKNNQKENQENEPKASSDKTAKKAEKPVALETEFNSKMRLRKIELDMKQKELEMELHRLEDEVALQLEYEKEAVDVRDSGFDDCAALRIKIRSPFNWKRFQGAKSTNQISLDTKKIVVLTIHGPSTTTIVSALVEKAYLNPDPQAASVSSKINDEMRTK